MSENYIHPCPVAGCDRTRKSSQEMCARHWSTIPAHLQIAELDAWDATVKDGRSEASWQAYLTARDAALATVPGFDMSVADVVDREALAEVDAETAALTTV